MTNTSQTNRFQEQANGEMNVMNHDLVRDHIDDLLREGAALRAERNEAEHRQASHATAAIEDAGPHAPVRVRLGRWLVGVGWAVAGGASEPHGSARRAA